MCKFWNYYTIKCQTLSDKYLEFKLQDAILFYFIYILYLFWLLISMLNLFWFSCTLFHNLLWRDTMYFNELVELPFRNYVLADKTYVCMRFRYVDDNPKALIIHKVNSANESRSPYILKIANDITSKYLSSV